MKILEAVGNRRALALPMSEWKQLELPYDDQRDVLSVLMDIMAHVPTLVEEADTVLKGGRTGIDSNLVSVLHKNLFDMANRIYDLIAEVGASSSGPPYWPILSSLCNPSDELFDHKLFPFALEFESMHCAVFFVMAWAFLLPIFSVIIQLHQYTKETSKDDTTLEELPQLSRSNSRIAYEATPWNTDVTTFSNVRSKADKTARYICQSIAYLYRIEMGLFGPQATTYAQSVLRRYFQEHSGYSRELDWCLQIKRSEGPGLRTGLELMSFTDKSMSTS